MLTERIMGAFTFRKGIYAEVEQDASFTSTAWLLDRGHGVPVLDAWRGRG